jgi:ubiquinone/menaquinone biosynthesis C-methylase UbiE
MGNYLKIYSQLTPQELRQLNYKELYKKLNPKWDDSLILLCNLFKPFIKPELKILDAGCGHGNIVIDEFRKNIKKAVGIDFNKEATSKNVCLDEIVIGDLENMPFSGESFDIVTSFAL